MNDSLTRDLLKYVERMSMAEDPLLAELDRETHLRAVNPQMASGHLQGALLTMMSKLVAPSRILEIGTFTGYSTLCLTAGLREGGQLDTIEADEELESISQPFFDRSPHGSAIRRHTGAALEILPQLDEIYDLVFIDGDKREYLDYYSAVMGDGGGRLMVRSGSVILADNILWYGKVADPRESNDPHTAAIDRFNAAVAADPRVENVIIPIRDGLNFIRVK